MLPNPATLVPVRVHRDHRDHRAHHVQRVLRRYLRNNNRRDEVGKVKNGAWIATSTNIESNLRAFHFIGTDLNALHVHWIKDWDLSGNFFS
jgi:hypothetical protein